MMIEWNSSQKGSSHWHHLEDLRPNVPNALYVMIMIICYSHATNYTPTSNAMWIPFDQITASGENSFFLFSSWTMNINVRTLSFDSSDVWILISLLSSSSSIGDGFSGQNLLHNVMHSSVFIKRNLIGYIQDWNRDRPIYLISCFSSPFTLTDIRENWKWIYFRKPSKTINNNNFPFHFLRWLYFGFDCWNSYFFPSNRLLAHGNQ